MEENDLEIIEISSSSEENSVSSLEIEMVTNGAERRPAPIECRNLRMSPSPTQSDSVFNRGDQFRSLERSITDAPSPGQSVENKPKMISNGTQTSPMKLNITKLEIFSIPPVSSALPRRSDSTESFRIVWSDSDDPDMSDAAKGAKNLEQLPTKAEIKRQKELEQELAFEEQIKNILMQAKNVSYPVSVQ
jgi:hypothetical protein